MKDKTVLIRFNKGSWQKKSLGTKEICILLMNLC